MKGNHMFLRTPYNYDMNEASDASGLSCPEPSLAQQSEKDECDINTIVRRFNLTGQLPQGIQAPRFGDFTEVTDYHTALNVVLSADSAFMALPAEIRARFDNNAGAFVDFVSDENNRAEAEKLGLVFPADAGGTPQGGAQPRGDGGESPMQTQPLTT